MFLKHISHICDLGGPDRVLVLNAIFIYDNKKRVASDQATKQSFHVKLELHQRKLEDWNVWRRNKIQLTGRLENF